MFLKLANFGLLRELNQVEVAQAPIDVPMERDKLGELAEAALDKFECQSLEADARLDNLLFITCSFLPNFVLLSQCCLERSHEVPKNSEAVFVQLGVLCRYRSRRGRILVRKLGGARPESEDDAQATSLFNEQNGLLLCALNKGETDHFERFFAQLGKLDQDVKHHLVAASVLENPSILFDLVIYEEQGDCIHDVVSNIEGGVDHLFTIDDAINECKQAHNALQCDNEFGTEGLAAILNDLCQELRVEELSVGHL